MAAGSDTANDTVVSPGERSTPISVVYVDDYEELCELTAAGLEEASDRLSVTTAVDPTIATDKLLEYDCIVSDYEMPNTDGIELLRQVRALDADIPFILYTGEGSEDVASDAIELDVTDYLTKRGGPERFTRLAHRIESVVDARRATEVAERTRQRASDAIQRERARFRALIEHSPAMTGVLDEFGTFEYVSPSVEDVLGRRPRELVGESAFEPVHEEDRERLVTAFQRCLKNPEYRPTVEYRYRHSNGEWLHLETKGVNRLDDPAVEGYIVNTRDITEQKRTEQRLRQERNLTERILEVSPTPMFLVDAESRVIRANDRAAEVFGMAPDEIHGLSPVDSELSVRRPDGTPVASDQLLGPKVVASEEERHGVEYHVDFPSGSFRVVVSGAPVPETERGLAAISVDEVDRIEATNSYSTRDNNT